MNEGINEKLKQYRGLTLKALEKASVKKGIDERQEAIALDFLEMAKNYFNDAQFFEKKGKKLEALAAYSYAHAWLDAGVRAKVLDGKNDSKLFTLP